MRGRQRVEKQATSWEQLAQRSDEPPAPWERERERARSINGELDKQQTGLSTSKRQASCLLAWRKLVERWLSFTLRPTCCLPVPCPICSQASQKWGWELRREKEKNSAHHWRAAPRFPKFRHLLPLCTSAVQVQELHGGANTALEILTKNFDKKFFFTLSPVPPTTRIPFLPFESLITAQPWFALKRQLALSHFVTRMLSNFAPSPIFDLTKTTIFALVTKRMGHKDLDNLPIY